MWNMDVGNQYNYVLSNCSIKSVANRRFGRRRLADRIMADGHFGGDIWPKGQLANQIFHRRASLGMENLVDGHLADCDVRGGFDKRSHHAHRRGIKK